MPDSLSQTSRRGTAPSCPDSNAHIPDSRSAVVREGIITAVMNFENEATITSTGSSAALPSPRGIRGSGNHRSHWTWSPGSIHDPVRRIGRARSRAGAGPRSAGTRSPTPSSPTRSASTVAGIDGVASSRARTRCSNGAKLVGTAGLEYRGGLEDATAFATVFLETPRSLAICAFGTRSLRCSRRINAQSSKVITSPSWVGAHSSSVTSAQFSSVIDNGTWPRLRPEDGSTRRHTASLAACRPRLGWSQDA